MNNIISIEAEREYLRKGYLGKILTPKIKKTTLAILVIALVLTYARYYVLADNQPTVDPITTLNAQINEIDKKLMVNSQEYNELEKHNSDLMFQYTGNQLKQDTLESTNTLLRAKKHDIQADKEALLLGK